MSRSKLNRLDKIKKMLIAQTRICIKEFSASLNVSEITIRRDLILLEEQGFIRLVNGVAIYRMNENTPLYPEYNLSSECTVFQDKKERIGKKAASLIELNDVVAIDSGSTTAYLSQICLMTLI